MVRLSGVPRNVPTGETRRDTSAYSGRTAFAVALVLMVRVGTASGADTDAKPGEAESLSAGFRKAARLVLPAVVTVRAVGATPEGLTPGASGGSGVVVDAGKGFVLTNDHLVQAASRLVVVLPDGRQRPVSQVRRDPQSDLALLVIDPKGLTRNAEWGDSHVLDVGDWVIAVGQPFGLSNTVTAGIVSGKGRGVGLSAYEDLIQTDAAINPGNSGGPLVNLKGQVVGINTAFKTARGGFEGFGFAVPSARAKRIADDLARTGTVARAYLGLMVGPVDAETAEAIDQPGALVVNGVSDGGPAARAGVRRGDLLVKLQGRPLQGLGSLQSAVEFADPREPLVLTVDRSRERLEFEVRPEVMPVRSPGPDRPAAATAGPEVPAGRAGRPGQESFADLGFRLGEPTEDLARRFKLAEPARGLVVIGVEPDGPADRGGLEIGMVITDAAQTRVDTLSAFRDALGRLRGDRDVLVRVLRGTKAEFRIIPRSASGRPAPEGPL